MRKPKNYINNKDFYAALATWKERHEFCVEFEKDLPPIPDYIGECFMAMATKLATKGIFYKYPYKEEMIGDAIINCVEKILNFDHRTYYNPFAFFTSIIYNAFFRRIRIEKGELYGKLKLYKENLRLPEHSDVDFKTIPIVGNNVDFDTFADEYITDFETAIERKKNKEDGNSTFRGHTLRIQK